MLQNETNSNWQNFPGFGNNCNRECDHVSIRDFFHIHTIIDLTANRLQNRMDQIGDKLEAGQRAIERKICDVEKDDLLRQLSECKLREAMLSKNYHSH